MEIYNETEFTFAPFLGRVGFPNHSLTSIVKGTFDLRHGQKAVLSGGQLFATASELYEDDKDGQGGARYESDFAYFKPRADLLLAGRCHPPNGKPTKASRVTFKVGSKTKSLAVFGDRYWKGAIKSLSDPEPFSEMELRYENSYGGEGYKKNPVGKGFKKAQNKSGAKIWPLPNIENIHHRINSPSDHPAPAGFAPIGSLWHERFSKMGTYKRAWLKERWPWFPKDFDWSHFNAATTDQQVEGYLKGDEKLYFENLHPIHSQYHSQLPALRVRLFINELESLNSNNTRFKEVTMNLDTLWVDMESEKLVLVWRGLSEVLSEEYEEIHHVFIVTEKLDNQTQPLEHYHQQFIKKLADEESDKTYEVKPFKENTIDVDKKIEQANKEIRASLIEAGIDPDNLPKQTAEQKAEDEKLLKEMGIEPEPTKTPFSRERFTERFSHGETFIDEDLTLLDLSNLELPSVNLETAILSKVNFNASNLSNAILSNANLMGANLSGANLREANLKDADLTGTNLSGADLTGACLDDAIFEKAQLKGAILDNVSAIDSIFSEANLTETSFRSSQLQGADFSDSTLKLAIFHGANLFEATLNGAKGENIDLSNANLTELRASDNADFSHGNFQGAKGTSSIWEGANLTEANLSYSNFEGADFSAANLEAANLFAANMKFTRFIKADLTTANLEKMNLFQGSLEKANLTKSNFNGANLYGVEFLDAVIKETQFKQSNLKMTKLSDG